MKTKRKYKHSKLLQHKKLKFKTTFKVWRLSQIKTKSVIRWKKYIKKNPLLRIQNLLEHNHSIVLVGSMILNKIHNYLTKNNRKVINRHLVLDALQFHDMGEMIIGDDVVWKQKGVRRDLLEISMFRNMTRGLDIETRDYLNAVFLLQFANIEYMQKEGIAYSTNKHPFFSEQICDDIVELSTEFHYEAEIFSAIEAYDYMLYAYEALSIKGGLTLAIQVARNQVKRLDIMTNTIPGFSLIWTSELSHFWKKLIQKHKDIPTE